MKKTRKPHRRSKQPTYRTIKDGYVMRRFMGRRLYYEHRLIWVYHYGPIPDGKTIHHINGVKDDNRISNLMLVTKREHARRHQLMRPV